MSTNQESTAGTREAEQIQLAREVGGALTEAFVAYVRGNVSFEDLSFGVYDALHDLMLVRSGEYELVEEGDDDHDHHHHDHDHDHEHHHHHDDDDDEIAEQEELAQEPVREDES